MAGPRLVQRERAPELYCPLTRKLSLHYRGWTMKNAPHPTTRPGLVLPAILLFAIAGCAEVEFRIGTPSSARGGSAVSESMGKIIRLDPRFDEIVPKGAAIEKLAEGFAWSEGPVWLPEEKAVLFSDIPNNRIMRLSLIHI